MIKIVETKDYDVLATMNEEIQAFHHQIQPDVFKPYDKEGVAAFFKSTVNNENAVVFVAQENEIILGYVLLFIINFADNPFMYSRTYVLLDQILVLKAHQRKGVGKLLLDATFDFARAHNIDMVEVNHWTQNDLARKFFGRNKFEYYNEKMRRTIE